MKVAEKKQKVQKLRSLGYSFSLISNQTGVPVTTAHYWCKGINPENIIRKEFDSNSRLRMSIARKKTWKNPEYRKNQVVKKRGENNPNWISDRSLLKPSQYRNNAKYREWRKCVYARDNFSCRIANDDCCGSIEAHHILPWRSHKSLRYEVNNGITLCQFHHPRKQDEELQMVPTFTNLINQIV